MVWQTNLVYFGETQPSAQQYAGGEIQKDVSLAGSTGTNGTTVGNSTNAVLIDKDIILVTAATSSTAGNALILPKNKGSGYCVVFNNSPYTIYVFAPVGCTINNYNNIGFSTNAGNSHVGSYQIGTNKSATFMSPDGLFWLGTHAG